MCLCPIQTSSLSPSTPLSIETMLGDFTFLIPLRQNSVHIARPTNFTATVEGVLQNNGSAMVDKSVAMDQTKARVKGHTMHCSNVETRSNCTNSLRNVTPNLTAPTEPTN